MLKRISLRVFVVIVVLEVLLLSLPLLSFVGIEIDWDVWKVSLIVFPLIVGGALASFFLLVLCFVKVRLFFASRRRGF